ncbi:MAG: DUF1491 family protein [Hyphomonas sp.]|nr:DUF1491 family protein [Hyphomonas sp.]
MFEERLSTRIWVDALMRRAQVAGSAAFIVQRGEESRGDVLIKVSDLAGGARAYVPRTSMEGERVFVDLEVQGIGPEEASVDDYISRARDRDRDLWIIEIEDREGRHFLTEPIE